MYCMRISADLAASYFSIVFALVKSMLLFHLGDLLLTFSSSLATKHTIIILQHSNSYYVFLFPVHFISMQKFHVGIAKVIISLPFISLFRYLFSLTHSHSSPQWKIAKTFETLAAAAAKTTTTRLVKWIHILFLLSFIVLFFEMLFLSSHSQWNARKNTGT